MGAGTGAFASLYSSLRSLASLFLSISSSFCSLRILTCVSISAFLFSACVVAASQSGLLSSSSCSSAALLAALTSCCVAPGYGEEG